MITSILRLSIERRGVMMLLALFIAFFGMYSYNQLPIDAVAPVMLLIWSIFSEDPEIMIKVDLFFDKFNNMPFWYQALFIGVVSAIYGLKGADIIKRK